MRPHPGDELPSLPRDTGAPPSAEVRLLLQQAVRGMDRGGTALVELALYLHHVHQRPAEAERLLEEGAAKALGTLEAAWAGLLGVLVEQRKHARALELGEVAQRTFPGSSRIAEALESARAHARPPSEE